MLRATLAAVAAMLAAAAAFGQGTRTGAPSSAAAPPQQHPAPAPVPAGAAPATRQTSKPKPTATASSPAAMSALSNQPTYDEGTIARIRAAALSYSDLAVRGGWPTIPPDAKFSLGVQGANDDLLRRRLILTDDLAADKTTGAFDQVLAEAVKRFQARHGLAPTGTVTPRTLAALNVPVQKRIRQLEASLQRLTQMDFRFGYRYVIVNIPAAFAEAIENDQVVRHYRVIVGKTEKPSPTLTSMITDVVFNPTWTVPWSITKTEIAGHMRKDPTYLSRMHMDLVDAHDNPVDPGTVDWSSGRWPNVTVRQRSGAWNALGAVKINLPNSYAVYMHDTNQRSLFSDDYRFDSHGCARVDNVRDLAAWLLEDQPQWSRAAIDAAIATGQRQDIQMARKVPVAWIYLTAWATKDETIQFRNDIYDHDEQLLEATAEEAAFFNQAEPPTPRLAQ